MTDTPRSPVANGTAPPVAGAGLKDRAYRRYVLAALVVVYAFNFIDRQILSILAVPIRRELALTDTELGLLGGVAFALLYSTLGIPAARLADRTSRTRVIGLAFALWSAMSMACGFARSFVQLFIFRVGVGIGEAGGVAPSHALICDYYPPGERARAFSIYAFGIPIGTMLGLVGGGMMAGSVGWRTAFASVGLAGLIAAPVFWFTVREAQRGRFDAPRTDAADVTVLQALRALAAKPSFWWLAIGAACSSTMGYGIFFWMPSFFVRSFGLSVQQAGTCFGLIVFAGGMAGIWLGGALVDRLGRRGRGYFAFVPAAAFVASGPLYVLAVGTRQLSLAVTLLLVPTALSLSWLGPLQAAVQHLVPPQMRATASASFLFINTLLGLTVGTLAIGALSDAMRARYGDDSLRHAIEFGTVFYLLAAGCLFAGGRRLARDWVG